VCRVFVVARLVAELRRALAALDAGFFAPGFLLAGPRALFETALLVGARGDFARALVDAAFFFVRLFVEVTLFLGARFALTVFFRASCPCERSKFR
jgi:hypothetical protein